MIEVNHLWKEYHKGIDRRYKSLRDTLVGMPGRLFGAQKEKFWALEDLDFKVAEGEIVGIIGPNGAGKSTLLKILSRITPPTKGEVILKGRVASMLEVGTGFHPELTGRENIFFNGSILGMKYHEVKDQFDEIVDFSGVESYIDTPLKHFSSGMQLRLAFAVAAHLESEILLIDEVLAVGDASFQKKCIGKMEEMGKSQGRTILMVSHDMSQMMQLCNRGILLQQGTIKSIGTMADTVNYYLNETKANDSDLSTYDCESLKINSATFNGIDYPAIDEPHINLGEPIIISFEYQTKIDIDNLSIAIDLRSAYGELYAHLSNEDDGYQLFNIAQNTNNTITITTDKIWFAPGRYFVSLWIGRHHTYTLMRLENLFSFSVLKGNISQRMGNVPKHSKTYLHTQWT